MRNSITTGIVSAITSGAIDYIRDQINKSENSKAAWQEVAKECAIRAEVAYRQNIADVDSPNIEDLKQELETIGTVAQDLSVRGKRRGYDEEEIDLVRQLAIVCGNCAGSPTMSSGANEQKLKSNLSELCDEIHQMIEE
jgi:hypothetical protein